MAASLGVGLIGSGFMGATHALTFQQFVPQARLQAVSSPTPGKAARFAEEYHIPAAYQDYRELLARPDIDLVVLAVPNHVHCEITVAAAGAGKHVICEKPLCRTLQEADQMIAACQRAGVLLMYAEELVFVPKYVRAKQLVDEGALGTPFLVKQSEAHSGPHEPWFWDVTRAGGGVLLDTGCHSIEYGRWVLGKPRVKSVTSRLGTFVHAGHTEGEDHSLCIVEYENGAMAIAENSWAVLGGLDDRCEIFGTQGHTHADLVRGSSLLTYSDVGYEHAVEKADTSRGWTYTLFEEEWQYGFAHEMSHFVNCVNGRAIPRETGEDGREVLKIIYAAYQSAGMRCTISWPYEPPVVEKPIDLWKSSIGR